MLEEEVRLGLTFDDVILIPAKSEVLPSRPIPRRRSLAILPSTFLSSSSAMDTVTESRLAIALAREGGIGVIHRVLSPVDQAAEVDKVKKSESGMILDPITIAPDQTIRKPCNSCRSFGFQEFLSRNWASSSGFSQTAIFVSKAAWISKSRR